jgi:hypothetical protein
LTRAVLVALALGFLASVAALAAAAPRTPAPRAGAGAGTGTGAAKTDDDDDTRDQLIRLKPGTPGLARGATADQVTRCAPCHRVEGWERVRFNHDPTGFPLHGAHVEVACAQCHGKRFDTPVADTCASCHRDRHAGEFGMHCEGCHDETSWHPLFQADAHRRTNFPLVGKHALIPCQECHGNLRDRSFARAASGCDACHEPDFLRTSATSIDHVTNNYSRQCQTCHNTFRFFPVSVGAHDTCFRISGGSHHGIRCLGCHTSLSGSIFTGACATGTFTCSECHSHTCAHSDTQHKTVMGYECANAKCYECHKLGGL